MVSIPNITFIDKSDGTISPLPDVKKLVAADAQEIKDAINALQGQFQDTEFLFLGDPDTDNTVMVSRSDTGFEIFRRESGTYNCKMRVQEDGVILDVPLTTTTTSVNFGENGSQLSSAGQAIIFEGTDDDDAFVITNKFNPSTGSDVPVRSRLIGRNTYDIQPLKNVNSVVNPTFTYTVEAIGPDQSPPMQAEDRRHIDGVVIESPDSGTVTVELRENDANGRLLREPQTETIVANTETFVTLTKSICLDVGTVVYVNVTGGVRLKGTTILGQFAAFLKSRSYLGYTDRFVTRRFIGDFSADFRDALEALTGDDRIDATAIKNQDEIIRDVVGATLVPGMGVTIDVNDASDTITINATGGSGGGTPPPANADIVYYGLSPTNNPATVDIVTLTTENNPTNPDTIRTGVTTQGQYFILLVPQADDITSIFDTILQQDVTNIFTETDNVRTISSVSYKSYVIGPLNAGVDEEYVINFGA